MRPAYGPPVGGDACVVPGRRFCVLQRQRGASPAANRDAGLICAPFLSCQVDHSRDSRKGDQGGITMKITFAMAALAVVLLLGNQNHSSAQRSDHKVTVSGMFGERAMGDTFKPRPSTFGGTLQRGPSGNFLGTQGRMFNPSSSARYRVSVVPARPFPQPEVKPELLLESQPPLPLPQTEPSEPIETVPSEPGPPRSDLWMRSPSNQNNGGSPPPGPQAGQPADFGPPSGSGAGSSLPLSSQYTLGFGSDVLRPIRQVSQGGYLESAVADRLEKILGDRTRSPISVSLIDGTATIRGQVATQHDRRLVGYLVMFEPGVRHVNNQVSTEEPGLLSGGPGR